MALARPQDWKNPTYADVYQERGRRLARLREGGPEAWDRIIGYYRAGNYGDFIEDWCFTVDPRRAAEGKPPQIPFMLFQKQHELVAWLQDRMAGREPGLIEKTREVGCSWIFAAFGVAVWLFQPGSSIGFGSYDAGKVDKLGEPDALLEKIRVIVRNLPPELQPIGWIEKKHANYMRIVNPETGATIKGETGDDVGRGGRSTIYFVDEFAHFDHAETVDAALSQNTPTRIYGSTVRGTGNLFYRKRMSGVHPVFIFDWKDDPRKDEAWYAKQVRELEPLIVAQEIDRDYHASVERTVIESNWIKAAQEIGPMVGAWPEFRYGVAGLDVATSGKAKSVFVARFGPFVDPSIDIPEPDGTRLAREAVTKARLAGVSELNFDVIGVGEGVATGMRHMDEAHGVRVSGINVGVPATDRFWPDGKRAAEKFSNLKAEAWWIMRVRFQKTYEHWLHLKGMEGGQAHPLDELIVLDARDTKLAHELGLPTWDPMNNGKVRIESKESLKRRGIPSPDHAEALSLTFTKGARMDQSEIAGLY